MKKLFTLFIGLIYFILPLSAQFTCGDTLIDIRDGKKYRTVLIGTNCWFKDNLNYGKYVKSDSLGTIHSQQTNNGIAEKYAQNNDTTNLPIYGGLYEQAELMNYSTSLQGLCPSGWHVSTDQEWKDLIIAAGASLTNDSAGTGGNKLKALGEGFGAGAGTDNVGFSAKHGGDRDGFGIFYGLGARAIYWTSTLVPINKAYHYMLWDNKDTIQRLKLGIVTTGFSCRCVKDASSSGTDDNSNGHYFDISPNPSNNIINININSSKSTGRVIVYNVYGQTIFESTNNSQYMQINVSEWSQGVYFINLYDEQKKLIGTKKLIKQ